MRLCAVACMLAGVVASAGADEVIEIKLAYPKKNDKVKVTAETHAITKITVSVGGKDAVHSETDVKTRVEYTDTVDDGDGRTQPTKLTRKYSKAVVVTKGVEEKHPLHDKTIVIEKIRGKYTFQTSKGFESVKPEPVEGEAKELLDNEFNRGNREDLIPRGLKKSKGGDWPITYGQTLAALRDKDYKIETEPGVGKLVHLEQKNKRPYGTIEVKLSADVKHWGEKPQITAKKGKLSAVCKYDGFLDGSAPPAAALVEMKLSATGEHEGCDVTLEMTVVDDTKTTYTPAPPEKKDKKKP